MYSFLKLVNERNFTNEKNDNKGNVWPLQLLKEKYDLNIKFLHCYTVHSLGKQILLKIKKDITFELRHHQYLFT